jgi:hypothetical protein
MWSPFCQRSLLLGTDARLVWFLALRRTPYPVKKRPLELGNEENADLAALPAMLSETVSRPSDVFRNLAPLHR